MYWLTRLTMGAALAGAGTHALWRYGLHEGRFFATSSLLIALSGIVIIVAGGVE
jgi:hypothetical protein